MLVHLRGLRILPQPKANTMKKALILLALWASFAVIAYSQSTPPQTWMELDGSPRVTAPTTIVWPNGSLTVSGKKITVSGTGGGGCTPPGTLSRVLYDDGAGGCTSTSGLTATATTITIVNGVTATFSRAGVLYTGTVTTDAGSVQTMLLQGDRATVASNDEAYVTYRLSNAAGTQTEVARMTWAIPTATAAAENGRLDFSVMTAGALAKELQLAGDDLSPSVSDGLALGTVSLPWSDIFLATGAVIDFANNDSRITHSSGVLTISAGDLRVTTAGTNAASVATLNGTQSFQSKTITNSNNVLGGVTMTLGSDADGDTYYRASNVLTRLAKGTAGQVLTMNAGATAPEWAAAGGGGGTPGGSTTQLQYNNAGSFGGITGATTNGTFVTLTTPVIGAATGTSLTLTGNMQVGIAALYKFGGFNTLSYTDGVGPKFTDGNTSADLIFDVQSLTANRTVTWPNASGTVAFTSGVPAAANPSASVGLAAVNGSASTFLRSDGAPALDQGIAPTWTAAHAFSNTITQTSASATAFESGPNGGTNPVFRLVNSTASAATGLSITGRAAGAGVDLTVITSSATESLNVVTVGTGSKINHVNVGNVTTQISRTEFKVASNNIVGWTSGFTDATAALDTGFERKAAAHVRINNGSTGAGSLVIGTSTVGSIGTSGVGVLAIANGTAPSSSPADTAQLYTADINATAGSAGFHIRNEINTAALIMPGVRYKTDTGDPSDVFEGMMLINTFDNTFKVYAEGAWRTITTW